MPDSLLTVSGSSAPVEALPIFMTKGTGGSAFARSTSEDAYGLIKR